MCRIAYLDYTRGFAILLVIVGHLIQFNFQSGLNNRLFDIIYSFHMPLFFFISGCARGIYLKSSLTVLDLCKKVYHQFCSLIVPSIVWTIVMPYFFSRQYELSVSQISGYWFLNVLFAIVVVWDIFLYINIKKTKKYLYPLMVVVISILFIVGFKRIPISYFLMYVIGFYFQKYNCLTKLPPIFYSLFFLIFCLFSGYFDYGETPMGDADRIWLQFPLSICASLSLLRFFSMCELKDYKICAILGLIGRYTLGIYLCHFFLVRIPFIAEMENGFNLLIQFVGLLSLSLGIALLCMGIQRVIKNYPFLHKIMYGK